MLFKQILMSVISVFFVLGAADYLFGNRYGLGAEFERAFSLIGRIALAVCGMICLSPVISKILAPLVGPIFGLVGIDPALAAPILIAPDSGGYAIAMEMAKDPAVGAWAGTVVAAHIGSTVSFNIPVALGVIPKDAFRHFSLGALCGVVACPLGCFVGGLLCGLPVGTILVSLIPVILVALVIVLGLTFRPETAMRVFVLIGRILTVIIVVGLVLAAVRQLTGFEPVKGMRPIGDAMEIAGNVGLTMAGIMSLTALLFRLFKGPLAKISRRLKIDEVSLLYTANSLVTCIAGASLFKEMNARGRVIFAASVCSMANIFGAHLSFIGNYVPDMLMPTVVGKLVSGALGIFIALLFSKRLIEPTPEPDTEDTREPAVL